MRKFSALLAFVLLSFSAAAQPPENSLRVNDEGVAIDGYSPVAYFTKGTPSKGLAEFASNHQGVEYWLGSAEELKLFEQDPARYVPAHGGWCTLMMAGSGRRTPGHPESFAIVDDRLMLFWSGDTDETKGMGLSNWESKTRGSERRERGQVENADKKWLRFLEGRREAKIMLYKPSDKQAVSARQLEQATVSYVE